MHSDKIKLRRFAMPLYFAGDVSVMCKEYKEII